jgi:hypothetical protein
MFAMRGRAGRELLCLWVAVALLGVAAACSDSKAVPNKDGGSSKGNARRDGSAASNDAAQRPVTADAGRARDAAASGPRDGSVSTDGSARSDAAAMRDAGTMQGDGSVGGASTDGGGSVCPSLGWCRLVDTKLASVCPDPKQYEAIQANEGCGGVINDWCGGVGDTKRNRLIVWGGGHRGYFGNEVYALDLDKVAMLRLNDPSDISSIDLTNCTSPEAYSDGRPSSRHTYDGLTYVADADKMYSVAGAGIPCGYAVQGTWTLDLAQVSSARAGAAAPWTNMSPDPHPTKATYGVVSDYDPNGKRVIVDDTYNLWSYDLGSNTYTLLNDSNATNAHIDYHMTGRVDPKRKLFVIIGGTLSSGGGVQVFDISQGSSAAQMDWTSQVTGCDGLLDATSPGVAYDPVQDRLVAWAGGDTIYLFNPDTKSCTTVSYGGGPGAQNMNGTFGRFRYFPALKVFAVVNDYKGDAYTLRLTQ